MRIVAVVLDLLLAIYLYVLLATAVLSWLIGFRALTTENRTVAAIDLILSRATEPVRRPVRWLLPKLGGLDVSPIVAIALIVVLRYLVAIYVLPRA